MTDAMEKEKKIRKIMNLRGKSNVCMDFFGEV
jgi:hypothetical protein